MGLFDDDLPKTPTGSRIVVGEDVSAHSEKDLTERITALEQEIDRVRGLLNNRGKIRDTAESLFGK